jgi:hypothetical protein
MTDSSEATVCCEKTLQIRATIFRLLDKIESLLINLTKIQSELFAVLSEIPPKRSQSEIEDILGIKVYLGKDYIDNSGIKIGESIDISETDLMIDDLKENGILASDFSITGSIYVGEPKINGGCQVAQDCAGNILTIEPREQSPEEIESAYIHSTSELWK